MTVTAHSHNHTPTTPVFSQLGSRLQPIIVDKPYVSDGLLKHRADHVTKLSFPKADLWGQFHPDGCYFAVPEITHRYGTPQSNQKEQLATVSSFS
jgi:hypothetical protein